MAKTINLGKVGVTLGGDYDSSKNYASRTCVFYNYVSWTSKKDVPAGIAPGTNDEYWQKVSERGAQGIQGERGPQGNSAFDGTGIELVNNLTQGGEAAALSAEQGKILKSELTELESEVKLKFIGSLKTKTISTTIYLQINDMVMFDNYGGYYFIQDGEYELGAAKSLILSEKPNEIIKPNLLDKGVGQTLYLISIERQYLGNGVVFALNNGGKLWCAYNINVDDNPNYIATYRIRDYYDDKVVVNQSLLLDIKKGTVNVSSNEIEMPINNVLYFLDDKGNPADLDNTNVNSLNLGFGSWNDSKNLANYNVGNIAYVEKGADRTLNFKYLRSDIRIEYNKYLSEGRGEDIFGIRKLFHEHLKYIYLYVEAESQTIKELWLDTISFDSNNTNEWGIVLGAWTNPEGGADNTYRQVAIASIIPSSNNTNIIDFVIQPLNNSGLRGYMKTSRSFFDYFYNSGTTWKTNEGNDLFCQFNINNIAVIYKGNNIETEDKNISRENKGLLPRLSFSKSPLLDSLSIYQKLLKKDKDITIVHIGDSISTNNNYATSLEDASYMPPRVEEKNLHYHISNHIIWKGQEYRRSDAMTDKTSLTPMFIESGYDKASNKYYDEAWDWQFNSLENNFYKLWTRVLEGNNCGVTFVVPRGTKGFIFKYRTDYLCSDSIKVTIHKGNGICRVFDSEGGLTEANGFVFSARETDVVYEKEVHSYDGTIENRKYRISRNKNLRFHIDNNSEDVTITIANQTSGRLNYWGIVYTPYDNILDYINVARGGHNIDAIETFEEWDIDAFKPDLILLQCQIINEGAMSVVASNTLNTPIAFANRFGEYISKLHNKDYHPEILPYVLYIGSQANIVDQVTGKYNCSFISEYGCVDVYKYIGELYEKVSKQFAILNFFHQFDEIAERKSKIENTDNKWISAIMASGQDGDTFTEDSVHLNDYGNLIAWRLLKPYFNL